MKGVLIFIFQTVSILIFSQRQEFLRDWSAILEFYNCTDNMQIEAEYFMYESHVSNKVYSKSHSIIQFKNNKIFQNIENIITLVDPENMVLVDQSEATIPLDRSPSNYFNILRQLRIDTSLESITKIELVNHNSSLKKYRLYIDQGEHEKIEISFHPNKKYLTEIILFYSTDVALDDTKPDQMSKPKLVIHFKPLTKVVEPFYTIQSNPFFSFDGKTIKAKSAYRNYQCVDNRIKFK